jgi:pimeloyl-ACP methyl ester carboxylesterase
MAHWVSQAFQAVGAVVAAVALVIGIYVFGSFWLMRGHAAERGLGVHGRELLRELFWAALTQPFLPLFYLFGGRLGPRREGGVPIVFVHGYMQNRIDFVYLARILARSGLGPMYGFNYPWFSSIPKNAARLAAFVRRVCEETNREAVDLVCHSLGGLVAMEMMRGEADRARLRVRRCVTIASPHGGVAWQGPIIGFEGASMRRGSKLLEAQAAAKLAVPTLSVYSSHDNVVHPKQTSSLARRGGRDVEIEGVAHLAILFSPHVARHVAAFLLEPEPEGLKADPEMPEAMPESDMKKSSSDPPPSSASSRVESRRGTP